MPELTQEEKDQQELERQSRSQNPGDTSIDDSIPAWQSVVFEANSNARAAREEAAALRRELDEARKPPVIDEPIPEGEAFNNPTRFISRITDAMERSVAPVNAFMKESQRKEQYFTLKRNMKAGANADALQAFTQIESHIDEIFLSNPDIQPTEKEFARQLEVVVGRLTLKGAFKQNNNNTTPNREVIPPNIRPTPSVVRDINSGGNKEPDISEFTENERRLMRENRMTPGEYKTMRDTPDYEQADAWKKILAARKAKGGK